jgi:hypothetical protein
MTKELNTKESADPKAKPPSLSPFESMLYTNLSGAIVALVFCFATDQVSAGLALCQRSEVS